MAVSVAYGYSENWLEVTAMIDLNLALKPLTQASFAPFGDVIESEARDSFLINNGMAERFHALANIDVRGDDGGAILSLVNSQKYKLPRQVDHVENHPLGSQAFIPLDQTPFIVVVCAACDKPNAHDLQAFVTNGQQGINYHAATWHHVLLTPYAAMNFLCVDRVGSGNNCIDHFFTPEQQRHLDI
jgi:ureidoglycolate lyase